MNIPSLTRPRLPNVMISVCAILILLAGLYAAGSVLAPIAFSFLIMALVQPLHEAFEKRISKLPALALTLLITASAVVGMGLLAIWSFGAVGRWLLQNASRFQELYGKLVGWLESHGLYVATFIQDYFDAGFLFRGLQQVTGHLHGAVSFIIVVFVFLMLGLLELRATSRNLDVFGPETAEALREAFRDVAGKLRKYMLVRAVMSLATGLAVAAFAYAIGLALPAAWGSIAFALNFIPFIGSFVATLFPTLFAMAQSESWQMAVFVFLCLNLIQFLGGSYIEPRVTGAALSISPFLVLFSVFFWMFLWGIAGALIGVQITIALLTLCAHFPSTQWISKLFSGRDDTCHGT